AQVVNGIHTDIVFLQYTDRTFVTITQVTKLGTLMTARMEESSMRGKSYEVQTLLGRRDDPLLFIYARQLMEQLGLTKPLLLAIALTDKGRDSNTFQAIVNAVLGLAGGGE
ncbi:unnamed protein product, partial [Phaeothamnion confervicola]